MTIIGIDFSIKKPACCIYENNTYTFISWPKDLPKSVTNVFSDSPVTVIERTDIEKETGDLSKKMRYEVSNALYLSSLITTSISRYLHNDTFVAFEGLSYGSSGNVVSQLSGYKYLLMNELIKKISLNNIYTYAPITIKKTAGCSEKGKTKANMIEAFKHTDTVFGRYISENEQLFKTKNGNWISHTDDIIDSYWTLETLKNKEFIHSI